MSQSIKQYTQSGEIKQRQHLVDWHAQTVSYFNSNIYKTIGKWKSSLVDIDDKLKNSCQVPVNERCLALFEIINKAENHADVLTNLGNIFVTAHNQSANKFEDFLHNSSSHTTFHYDNYWTKNATKSFFISKEDSAQKLENYDTFDDGVKELFGVKSEIKSADDVKVNGLETAIVFSMYRGIEFAIDANNEMLKKCMNYGDDVCTQEVKELIIKGETVLSEGQEYCRQEFGHFFTLGDKIDAHSALMQEQLMLSQQQAQQQAQQNQTQGFLHKNESGSSEFGTEAIFCCVVGLSIVCAIICC